MARKKELDIVDLETEDTGAGASWNEGYDEDDPGDAWAAGDEDSGEDDLDWEMEPDSDREARHSQSRAAQVRQGKSNGGRRASSEQVRGSDRPVRGGSADTTHRNSAGPSRGSAAAGSRNSAGPSHGGTAAGSRNSAGPSRGSAAAGSRNSAGPSRGSADMARRSSTPVEQPYGEERPGKSGTVVAGIFIGIGVLCLIVGGIFFVRAKLEEKKNQEQMEVLHNQLELDQQRQADEASRQSLAQGDNAGQNGSDSKDGADSQNGADSQSGSELSGQGGGDGAAAQAGSGSQSAAGSDSGNASGHTTVANPYAEFYRQNSDMAGWLKIEGTKIDYPIMQTMEDENYYLKRGFDKKSNQNGCLILDTDSRIEEPLSTNLIIHGHNMKSGEMFGDLTDYEDEKYYENHKYIKLFTKECERNYEVIAVFRSQVYKKTDEVFKFYKFFQADTQEEFDDWYNNIKKLSQYDTGVTAELGDRFLTLSTCVYHVENGRLVVVAKELEPGDYYEPLN